MLELDQVSKRFGEVTALDRVSFRVRPGTMTGFVGANGAGKTTTMRIVLGVTGADSGEVRWEGAPLDLAVRQGFGYMPEERGLYPKMPLRDQLVFLARLHGVDDAEARRRAEELLEALGLGERAGDKLDALSLGNQQRVQVAAALVHDPVLLVLDEPFSGLDPLAVDAMAGILRERAAAGVPVLFSSHQLELVERLCDEVVIVDSGRVVAAGDAQGLRRAHARARYRLTVEPDAGWLRGVPGLDVLDVDGPRALVELPTLTDADPGVLRAQEQELLRRALEAGTVREFTPVVPTLAELFREVVR
ncbi:ABC transporter ATP-binding protein [Vallicoccus soli]|uniref:ATP-binding cassette domain-containing protein n=1 Tax=Vallicoccus soli TaxID=2339232 RepID=A0A3A3YS24_9ACTN|nr:ATP-binding cassette domain-containing protein [Vallicoccus soli]RJK94200.1 ATP-binding cassette domain-containing protein [Vallicoccus soli]